MADQRSIKSYFGAPVKQLKRKAKPKESTVVSEKKKQRDNPTARIRKFQESWKETFPWVVHDANQDVMYCSTCRRYPAFANLQSSLYIGCGSGGKYRIDSLVHHNTSKEHYRCSLGWQLTVVHHLEIHPLCTGQPLAQNYHSTKDYQCLQNTYRWAISSRRTFFTTFTLYSKKRMLLSLCPSYKEDILYAWSTNISVNATGQ